MRVRLVGLESSASSEVVHDVLVSALTSVGVVGTSVNVQLAEAVERAPLRKAPLARALKESP